MSRRFRGESEHKVDTKGRVSIPALFRRVLEAGDPDWQSGQNPQLVVVYGDHRRNYLECYTMEAIEEVDAKIDALAAEAKGIFDAKFDSAAAPSADFTPATSGGTASSAGVDDLVKELQDAGARLAAEVKAETQK